MSPNRIKSDEPVVVQQGSGWWKNEGGYKLPSAEAIKLDPAKIAKAQADADFVAKLCGWV